MESIVLVVLIVGAILLLASRSSNKAKMTAAFEAVAASMSREEAEREYHRNCNLVMRFLEGDPLGTGMTRAQSDAALEAAVACKNRMNELDGLEHGPTFRARYRFDLLMKLKRMVG